MNQVTAADFEAMFPGPLPACAAETLASIDAGYRVAEPAELRRYLDDYERLIASPRIVRSREETLAAFERGWSENLDAMRRDGVSLAALKPGYFRGSPFLRFRRGLIVSPNPQLEFDLFRVARRILFERYLSGIDEIWELGCGSCQNLLMLTEQFPAARLRGCDWTQASKRIADALGEMLGRNIRGEVFDMTDAAAAPAIPAGAAIVTIHAFEQLGTDFEEVLSWLRSIRPAIVMQYEPVLEFYDPADPLDEPALRYCRKRRYLEGYYRRLRELEAAGKIEIVAAFRPALGGVLHESSMLVWKPKG